MAKKTKNIFDYFDDESPAGTEFRRLHVRLMREAENAPLRTIQFTSSRRGEGKSTTSSHLALTIARHMEGTLILVDCDLRKPRVHEVYNLPQAKGMTDFMRGVLPLKAVMKDTLQPNLKIITSGRVIVTYVTWSFFSTLKGLCSLILLLSIFPIFSIFKACKNIT